jgi:predicted MPP superfamily phosphohydrolase
MSNRHLWEPSVRAVPYSVPAKGIAIPVKIAFLSDLHGEDYEECLDIVKGFEPHLVIFGGDAIDERIPWKVGLEALQVFASLFPTYYVPGNHEVSTMRYDLVKRAAAATGVRMLDGKKATLAVEGNKLLLCGVEDPLCSEKVHEKQLKKAAEAAKMFESCSVLITHRPERVGEYQGTAFDLVLTGHAHGGQWRFPFLQNGFLAPDAGLFPKYTSGLYDLGGVTLLVSRGLAVRNTRVPRIGNPPEVSLITLVPKE